MMKSHVYLLLVSLFLNLNVLAQREIEPSNSLLIEGEVINPITYVLSDFDTFQVQKLTDQIIYNHKGEIKDTILGMYGIPFKKILEPVRFRYSKPKELNEFYFLLEASDGYKVVISWNELYNTDIGNNFFLVVEKDGEKMVQMKERIVFLATADLKSGRRYIKGLSKVVVKRV